MNERLEKFLKVKDDINTVIIGKDDIIYKIIAVILARGHILLEDIPGVGKTTLAIAFSKVMSLDYKRLQFTPDVLPTDVVGFSMYNRQKESFEYVEGAAICNLFLADEINRTSPKTQSALLELMEEGKVTVDGTTKILPKPFIVIATQNPIGSVGTQKLPESQLDRFMVKLSIGYPDKESEINILKYDSFDRLSMLRPIITAQDIIEARKEVDSIFVNESIYEYITELVRMTRSYDNIQLGLSPRGSIALLRMSKAYAYLSRRDYLTPDDVVKAFYDISSHRIIINSKAKIDGLSVMDVLKKVKGFVALPESV